MLQIKWFGGSVKNGHEWQMSINGIRQIKNNKKCPYCRNIKLCSDNSLAAVNKKLKTEWNYEKNKNLKPESFLVSSTKKVWWKCKKGHVWQARINLRHRGSGCPFCSGNRVIKEASILFTNPQIAKEWNYKKNGELKPENVSKGSGKNVWWKCKKGHVWQDTISHRTSGRGCPFCSGRRVTKENSLLFTNPEIAKEWNYEKNGQLKPENVSKGSGKKVWWVCEKGHIWQSSVCNRTRGNNCPICWQERRKKVKNKSTSIHKN